MSNDPHVELTALAINVSIPEPLRWQDSRAGVVFSLHTLNVRMLPDGHLAAKAYGKPVEGGRGAYVAFNVPERPELDALIAEAAAQAGRRWSSHSGLRPRSSGPDR